LVGSTCRHVVVGIWGWAKPRGGCRRLILVTGCSGWSGGDVVGGLPATGACIRVGPLGKRVPLLPAPLVKSLRLCRREAEGLIDRLSRTGCQGIAWPQRTVAAEGPRGLYGLQPPSDGSQGSGALECRRQAMHSIASHPGCDAARPGRTVRVGRVRKHGPLGRRHSAGGALAAASSWPRRCATIAGCRRGVFLLWGVCDSEPLGPSAESSQRMTAWLAGRSACVWAAIARRSRDAQWQVTPPRSTMLDTGRRKEKGRVQCKGVRRHTFAPRDARPHK
jgi:hypothetical protein